MDEVRVKRDLLKSLMESPFYFHSLLEIDLNS
jgi:hypothetical protein